MANRPLNVWIVDDDQSVRWVLEKALKQADMETRSFERAEHLLEAIADGEPDVLITDVRMPGMSGLDLLRMLKDRSPDLDVILMRKDPPFDNEFIYSTYILEAAEREGSLIVNRCQSLRDCNEKVFATQFPECCPTVLVSADMQRLRAFHEEHGDTIFKPLDGMGGSAIFRVQPGDPNVSVILETLTNHGTQTIMAQRYIPEIVEGDKRILMVGGEPVPYCLARVPLAGETRGNLAAGGAGRAQPLTDRDRWIAEQVAPALKEHGILFAGLDVIGDYLTEINVTSPTGIQELERFDGINVAGQIWEAIEARLG